MSWFPQQLQSRGKIQPKDLAVPAAVAGTPSRAPDLDSVTAAPQLTSLRGALMTALSSLWGLWLGS